jgi:hypothetical protein
MDATGLPRRILKVRCEGRDVGRCRASADAIARVDGA